MVFSRCFHISILKRWALKGKEKKPDKTLKTTEVLQQCVGDGWDHRELVPFSFREKSTVWGWDRWGRSSPSTQDFLNNRDQTFLYENQNSKANKKGWWITVAFFLDLGFQVGAREWDWLVRLVYSPKVGSSSSLLLPQLTEPWGWVTHPFSLDCVSLKDPLEPQLICL